MAVISISAAEIIEGDGVYNNLQFVVTLSEASDTNITVDYQTISGTAIEGSDFSAAAGTFTIQAGDTSGVITITTYGGTQVETDESFILELTNPVGAVFEGDALKLQAQGIILDDDNTGNSLALLVSDAQMVEGDSGQQQAVFEIRLSQASEETITLNYTTSDATAEAGSDYETAAGTVTFLPGETVQSVTVNVNGDTDVESTEQFSLLVTPTAEIANGVEGSVGTATIYDDDAGDGTLPVLSIASIEALEGDANYAYGMQFIVTLSEASATNITVDYQTISGTAVEGSDFSAVAGTFTIQAGDTSGVITITTYGGTEVETDESFILKLTNPVGTIFEGDALKLQAQGIILDDDNTGNTLALLVSDAQMVEGDSGQQQAVFEIRLSQASEETITLNYTTSDATAEAGSDYETAAGTVTFLPGETVQSVTVNVNGDTDVESTEQFSLLVTPTAEIANGVEGSVGTATIYDDDAGDGTLPVLSIASIEALEGDANYAYGMQFIVTLSEASATNITVDYQTISGTAVEGSDFSAVAGTFTIQAGDTSRVVTITNYGGTEVETDKSFILELTNPVGAVFEGDALKLQAQGIILDDDNTCNTLALLVSDAQMVEGDSGQQQAVFEIRLSQALEKTITLNYTTSDATAEAGSDYEAAVGTVTFLPGETVQSVTVNVNGDTNVESTELFSLLVTPTEEIANGVEGSVGTATIYDDDAGDGTLPVLSIASIEALEGDANYAYGMQFIVTLSEASATNITVDYQTIGGTAIEGVDFPADAGTFTIQAGDTSRVVTITNYGGTEVETDESFILELTNPVGAIFEGDALKLQAQGILLDDDNTGNTLALLVSDAQMVEGESGQQQAVFEIRLSQASEETITLNYTTSDATAEAGSDYETAAGTVTFLPGETVQSVTVNVNGDTDVESTEQFSLLLSSPQGADFGAGSDGVEATATILDDDASTIQPVISITSSNVLEGNGTYGTSMQFVVMLSEASTETVRVNYTTADGSAVAGSDYIARSGTLTFSAGQTSAIIAVTIYGGTVEEDEESFFLELSGPQNAALAGGVDILSTYGTIIDNDGTAETDGLPVLSASDILVQEASEGATATFVLNLSSASDVEITGEFSVQAGTATADDDFTPVSGTFSFDPGQTSVTVTVAIAADTIIEPTETIVLRLDNLSNARFSGYSDQLLAICEILDQGNLDPEAVADSFVIDEDTALAGNVLLDNGSGADSDLNGDALSVAAVEGAAANVGQTITLASGALLRLNADGSFDYDPNGQFDGLAIGESGTDSFEYTISDGSGGQDTAVVTIEYSGVNDAPVGNPDAFTAEEDTAIAGNVLTDNGSGADFDPEGDAITVSLADSPANGVVTLNPDGSFEYTPDAGYTGTDTFSYTVSDGEAASDPVTVTLTLTEDTTVDPNPFSTTLEVPDSMTTCQEGATTVTYTNDSSDSYAGVLILVEITGGLLADPQTGAYSDSLLLLGLGDGIGGIDPGESGTLELSTKLVSYPGRDATVSTSAIDLTQTIDWSSQKDLLKPEFLSDDSWDQIFENFQEALGDTGEDLVEVLAENANFLEEYGVGGSNATTAMAFELEQAGDFGSLAERSIEGSLGDGWAFIGDLALDISDSTGNISLQGTTLFSQLFSLNAENAAYYIVSSSVDQTVSLGGDLLDGAPNNRPIFSRNIDSSYTASSEFSGELTQTDDGFQIETDSGLTLYFGTDGSFVNAVTQNGLETTAQYDADSNISGFIGPYGETLTIVRDGSGQVTSIQDSTGAAVDLTFTDGQLTGAASADGTAGFTYDTDGYLASTTATGEPVTAFSYDDDGRLQYIDVGSGAETTTYEYDSLGGYTITDGAGTAAHVALTPSGSVTAVTNGTGQTTSMIYNESGLLTGVELSDGSVVDVTVDDQGRITSITDAEGSTVSYTYEGDSTSPASFTDAEGNTRSFTYNELGQMTSAEWPDGTSLNFTWDEDGNLAAYTTRSGETITYSYDDEGNLISESDGTAGETDYVYDDAGQLVSATTDDGTTTISYDDAGHVTQVEYFNGLSLTYTYDAAGNRASMTDQEGNVQSYTYDDAGRLATISNDSGLLVSYTYDTGGNLIHEENGNGTITTYSYDDAGRLLEIVDLDDEGSINSYITYTYDELGQRIGMETQDGTWTYDYDGSGQLISADFVSINPEIADTSIQYNYDAAGNRTSVVEDGVETVYVTNELNQYVSVGDETYSYDDNGNLISKTDDGGTWAYTYDVENRLTSVTSPTGDVTEYEYDVFGNRSAVIENGVRTTYLVDPFGLGNVVAEYDDTGDQVASYVNGIGLVAQLDSDGSVGYYNTDGVFSVTGITDASGDLVNEYVYTPFGNELYESETIENGYEFNGGLGVYEDNNDLTYMRARFYDSEDGRFISEDPLWIGGDVENLYRSVANNPISLIDPLGEFGNPYKTYTEHLAKLFNKKFSKSVLEDAIERSGITLKDLNFLLGGGKYEAALQSYYQNEYAVLERGDTTTPYQKLTYAERLNLAQHAGFTEAMIKYFEDLAKIEAEANILSGTDDDETDDDWTDDDWTDDDGAEVEDQPTSSATGDPHLKTFDGKYYDFQGAGEFTMVQGDDLELQIRTEPWSPRSQVATVITAVAMQVGDAVVGLYLDNPGAVNINGEFIELEVGETIAVDGGGIYRSGTNTYVVVNDHGDGFLASINSGANGYLNINPFLCSDRAGAASGLLGNADGDRTNDIALPDGTVFTGHVAAQDLYGEYADAWRVTDETSIFIYGDGESTATYTIDNFPLKVVTVDDLDPDVRAAAEAVALAAGLVEGAPEFNNAVLDVALTGDVSFAEGIVEYVDPEEEPDVLVVQEAPEPVDDTAETDEDTSVLIDVLANDTDPEGDTLEIVSASDANGGTVEIMGEGLLLYTPPADFNGETTLTYEITDGAGNTVSAEVAVNVLPVQDTPEAASDQFATDEATSVNGNVLADNGNGADTDADGEALSVVEVNGSADEVGSQIELASGALLTVGEDGHVIYDPNGMFDYLESGETATDSFEYTISDGSGGFDTQTATITINGVSDPVIISMGDAPSRLPRGDRDAWKNAWSDENIFITHKADYQDDVEAWSDVLLTGSGGSQLEGGDILSGDLGVSGSNGSDEAGALQEVDGTEAIKFELDGTATQVVFDLSRFYSNDDGNGNSEAIRLQAFDDEHNLLEDFVAVAESLSGDSSLTFEVEQGFSELVVTSGAYDGDDFILGALSDGTNAVADAGTGSDFIIDAVEFEFFPADGDGDVQLLGVADTTPDSLLG